MKKLLVMLGTLGIMLIAVIQFCGIYHSNMMVIQSYDNMVLCEDENGEIWEIETADKDIQKALELSVILTDQHTEVVFDDEIIHYSIIK